MVTWIGTSPGSRRLRSCVLALTLTAVVIPLSSKSAAATTLSQNTIVRNTDVASFGVGGMRGTGTGSITVAGVSGTITRAYLYWEGPTNSTDAGANASVTFAGSTITGSNIGVGSSNCWGFTNSQGYRANVTSIVAGIGNGSYSLSGFRKPGPPLVEVNGASLIVFFDDGTDSNNNDVILFDGNDTNTDNSSTYTPWNDTVTGITNYTSGSVSLELHVADGQSFTDPAVLVNGTTVAAEGAIFQGDSVPPNAVGGLWDIKSFPVTGLSAGSDPLTITSGTQPAGTFDCLALVVAAVKAPVGATGTAATVPDAPTLNDAQPGFHQAVAKWTPNGDGGQPIINYEIIATPSAGPVVSTFVCPTPAGCTTPPTSGTVGSLTNGTTYTITIKAVNAVGESDASNGIDVTPCDACSVAIVAANGSVSLNTDNGNTGATPDQLVISQFSLTNAAAGDVAALNVQSLGAIEAVFAPSISTSVNFCFTPAESSAECIANSIINSEYPGGTTIHLERDVFDASATTQNPDFGPPCKQAKFVNGQIVCTLPNSSAYIYYVVMQLPGFDLHSLNTNSCTATTRCKPVPCNPSTNAGCDDPVIIGSSLAGGLKVNSPSRTFVVPPWCAGTFPNFVRIPCEKHVSVLTGSAAGDLGVLTYVALDGHRTLSG